MGKSIAQAASLLLCACCWQAVAADPYVGSFVGTFGGEEYRLTLNPAGNLRYEGEIVIADEPLPLVAQRFGDRLAGQIGIGGDSFEFSAELNGDILLFRDPDGEIIRFSPEP